MDVCTQEEADTRMMVHLKDMIDNGSKTICVKTVDSDVMVILVGLFYKIKRSENVGNIWLEYGTGTNLRFFNVRDLYNSVGETKARGLLFFHAFTGSDTTSALRNQLGILGEHLMRSPQYFPISQNSHSKSSILILRRWLCFKDLLSACTSNLHP